MLYKVKKVISYILTFVVIEFLFISVIGVAYSKNIDELMVSLGITSPTEREVGSDFTLKDINDEEVSLSDYRGKVIFLNFWASWCPPCRMEMPYMEELYQRFKDRDFVMLAVDLRESRKKVKKFIDDSGLNFTILLDSNGRVADDYRVRAIPTTYIINRKGEIIGKAIGAREWASSEAFELIEHLLKAGKE